jgi:hypothetical protein
MVEVLQFGARVHLPTVVDDPEEAFYSDLLLVFPC